MPPSDERKPVTVLFADLAGSTELATLHDPAHLRAFLSAFFEIGATGWLADTSRTLEGR